MRLRHSVSASSNATADATADAASPMKNARQPKLPRDVWSTNASDYLSRRIVSG